jgi:hypothetical protein
MVEGMMGIRLVILYDLTLLSMRKMTRLRRMMTRRRMKIVMAIL